MTSHPKHPKRSWLKIQQHLPVQETQDAYEYNNRINIRRNIFDKVKKADIKNKIKIKKTTYDCCTSLI